MVQKPGSNGIARQAIATSASAAIIARRNPKRGNCAANRKLVAAIETPADRLFARYRGRPSRAIRRGRWTDGLPAAAW